MAAVRCLFGPVSRQLVSYSTLAYALSRLQKLRAIGTRKRLAARHKTMDYDRRLAVFCAAGLAPEGVPIILPNRMPGDSTRYANGMPDGWGDGDERPSDEYIACQIAQDNLRHGNPGTDGRIDSDLFARLRDGVGLQEWLDAGGDPNIRVTHQPPTFDGPYPSVPDFHTGGTPLLLGARSLRLWARIARSWCGFC